MPDTKAREFGESLGEFQYGIIQRRIFQCFFKPNKNALVDDRSDHLTKKVNVILCPSVVQDL